MCKKERGKEGGQSERENGILRAANQSQHDRGFKRECRGADAAPELFFLKVAITSRSLTYHQVLPSLARAPRGRGRSSPSISLRMYSSPS